MDLSVIVAGGASGIGEATVKLFASRGHKRIVIADRNREVGEALAAELNARIRDCEAVFLPVDIADEASVHQLVETAAERVGRIDLAVNCAGIGGPSTLAHKIEAKHWQRTLDVDLTGTFFFGKALIEYWLKQEPRLLRDDRDLGLEPVRQRGALVNIASINGNYASSYMADYVAAKHGVNGISKNFALENVDQGIRVNCVSPGCVFTPIMQVANFDMNAVKGYLTKQAMQRFAHPEEIASCIYYLCSDEASFVTGTNLYVDAGWSSH